ncbi:MAG: ABC transporter ATP-binding protein [Gammaproteobacteria bacterium]
MSDLAPALAVANDVIRLDGLRKTYNPGTPLELEVLHGIDMTVRRGELAALIGPSGSGKSTLLNLLGLLDSPSDGELYLMGKATRDMDDEQRTRLRNERIGFVFQFHHLITAFTVLENVLMPLMIGKGKPAKADIERAHALLEAVGLEAHAGKKANAISGGQQQRVAIGRALITRPALLLADEPTGNLDTHTAEGVFDLFRRFNREFGCAVLVVTHDPRLSARCDRTIELVDGRIVRDAPHPSTS